MKSLALLAGGLATRLYPITTTIPKAMVEIAGQPFIYHQLNLLKQNNIENVIICAGYLGEQIQAYVSDGKNFGINVQYSFDGDTLVGTGGAIKKTLTMLSDPFYIMYGDSFLDCPYQSIMEYFISQNKLGLMTVFRNNDQWDRSNIIFEDNKIVCYDKRNQRSEMKYIDYGLGILRKKAFEAEFPEVFDLSDLYMKLVEKGEMLGYEVKKRFYEIGSFNGIKETEKYLLNQKR